jgi:spermidine synthase
LKKKLGHIIQSYFRDIILESTSSSHNRELHVILSNGRYQLCTANAVYSYEDKYINFRKSFEWIDWGSMKIENVLILGLGLGSVPQMLEQKFRQSFEYFAVEIDEKIIDLANRYILDELDSPMQIFHTDALRFVKWTEQKFDMIIMDVFDNDKVPKPFETKEFLEDCKALLNDGGFLLFNRLNISEKDPEETMAYFNDVFIEVFPEGSCSEIEGNFILNSRKLVFALQNS